MTDTGIGADDCFVSALEGNSRIESSFSRSTASADKLVPSITGKRVFSVPRFFISSGKCTGELVVVRNVFGVVRAPQLGRLQHNKMAATGPESGWNID